MAQRRHLLALLAVIVGLVAAAPAAAGVGDPRLAALQAALAREGLYAGAVDGLAGPMTRAGVAEVQRRVGLPVTGRAGAATIAALGGPVRVPLGTRPLARGAKGWDVVSLQFLLAWHGFPSGDFDGRFGPRLDDATRRFQAWAGLAADGVAGPATLEALRAAPPTVSARFAPPLDAPVGDRFGPRGLRFHAGVDFPAEVGTAVRAAGDGTVVAAGFDAEGFGNLVVIDHGGGLTTYYAHLSRVDAAQGQTVASGDRVGLVGSTGRSTGPHLHFEVRLGGAAVDPLPTLGLA
jgi:peptidoglycan hydrolase-like protein with peptidoglycan-binding domain